jgi:hypothetical protein
MAKLSAVLIVLAALLAVSTALKELRHDILPPFDPPHAAAMAKLADFDFSGLSAAAAPKTMKMAFQPGDWAGLEESPEPDYSGSSPQPDYSPGAPSPEPQPEPAASPEPECPCTCGRSLSPAPSSPVPSSPAPPTGKLDRHV